MDRTERHSRRYGSKGAFLGNKSKSKDVIIGLAPNAPKKEDRVTITKQKKSKKSQ